MLRVERDGDIVTWRMARPETKNALNFEMLTQLRAAVDAAAADRTIRAAILTGEGGVFSSGGDLQELRSVVRIEEVQGLANIGEDLCDRIEALEIPVIAAIPGVAFGGGLELALACDMRIADDHAKLSFRHVRIGNTTAWGAMRRLVHIVGYSTAARLLYTAHDVGALEARGLRLVDYVADRGAAGVLAYAWAQDIVQGSPKAVAAMKRLLRASKASTDAMRGEERASFVSTWMSPDHADAVAAFFERRAPRWESR